MKSPQCWINLFLYDLMICASSCPHSQALGLFTKDFSYTAVSKVFVRIQKVLVTSDNI